MNTARRDVSSSIGTSNTSALAAGGYVGPPYVAVTEEYNGTNWTEVADISSVRANLGGVGTVSAGLVFGGAGPTTAVTEEWTGAGVAVTRTFTDT